MKNKDLYVFMNNASKLSNLSGFNFVMELARNKRKAKAAIEVIEELKEELPEYLKFKTEYLKLREDFADRDEQGNPLMMNIPNQPGMQTYKITEKAKEFGLEEKKLEKKYKKVLDEQQQKFIDYSNGLEADCTIDFLCVSEDAIPKNITVEQLELIEFMICPDKPKMKVKK